PHAFLSAFRGDWQSPRSGPPTGSAAHYLTAERPRGICHVVRRIETAVRSTACRPRIAVTDGRRGLRLAVRHGALLSRAQGPAGDLRRRVPPNHPRTAAGAAAPAG